MPEDPDREECCRLLSDAKLADGTTPAVIGGSLEEFRRYATSRATRHGRGRCSVHERAVS
jgi:hypothetical protein